MDDSVETNYSIVHLEKHQYQNPHPLCLVAMFIILFLQDQKYVFQFVNKKILPFI